METTTEKMGPTKTVSVETVASLGNPTLLAQAAAVERAHTCLQAMRTYWRAFFWCIFMGIGTLLWGYDIQISGALLSVPRFRIDFGDVLDGQPVLHASWQSAFNGATAMGGMIGAISSGSISDRLGQRRAVAVACIISIVGVLVQFLTPIHVNGILLVGKFINGFALGMYLACVPGYCAEVSPLALRGITTAAVNFWIVIGQLLANAVARGTGNWTNAYAYRLPVALQWIFPVILLIGLPFAPESPWWLVRKGRYEDAESVLILLGGSTIDAKLRREQMRETIALEDSYAATSTYMDCFRGENRKRTIVSMMVFALQEASGAGFVFSFSTYFFELTGFATSKAFNLGVGLTAIGVAGNLLAFYAVDLLGRRFLFNWGIFTCAVILLSMGFIWIENRSQDAKWAVCVCMMAYNFVYQVTIGPLAYVIFTEVSSAKLRSKTVGLGIMTSALCGMLANIIVPYLVNPDEANLGGYVGFIFGGLALAGSVWSYFFIPETKGRAVDELDWLYQLRVPARHFRTYRLYDGDTDKM